MFAHKEKIKIEVGKGVVKIFTNRLLKIETAYYLSLFIVGLLLVSQGTLSPISRALPGTDSSVFIYMGRAINRGFIPYKEVFDHKGPVLYLINFLGTLPGGTWLLWIFELLSICVAIYFAYKTAKIFSKPLVAFLSTVISISTVAVYFSSGNLVEEYALPFIFISLYIFTSSIWKEKNLNKKQLMILGSCAAAVLFLRPNMIAIWLSYCPILFFAVIFRKKFKIATGYILYFICGTLFVSVPIAIYLFVNKALNDFYLAYILFNLKYTQLMPGNRIMAITSYIDLLATSSLCILIYYLILRKNNSKKEGLLIFSLMVYFCASFVFIGSTGTGYAHYGMILVPCYLIPTVLLINHIVNNKHQSIRDIFFRALIVVALFMCILSNCIFLGYKIINISANRGANPLIDNILLNDPYSRKIYTNSIIKTAQIVRQYSGREQCISVTGNFVNIYLASQKMSCSKYIYQDPVAFVDKNRLKEYLLDLLKQKPKIIVSSKKISQVASFGEYTVNADKVLDGLLGEYYKPVNPTDIFVVYMRIK